jgi:hypothetical protein
MDISPSGSNPQILSNLLAQQRNLEQQQGSPTQTSTDGAIQGAMSGVTGSSPVANVIRKDFLTRVHQAIDQAKNALELARKNPQGFSGLNSFLEQLKQSYERSKASPQTGPRNADLATQTPRTLEEDGLMNIPFDRLKQMTPFEINNYTDMVRRDQQSRIPSKPPGVTALASSAGLGATAAAVGQSAVQRAGLGPYRWIAGSRPQCRSGWGGPQRWTAGSGSHGGPRSRAHPWAHTWLRSNRCSTE